MTREDHPRTRGVYVTRADGFICFEGSSPHTRGLLRSVRETSPISRIIPAHAGFTFPSIYHVILGKDHPRTRGVYDVASLNNGACDGSSPHTRGLLPVRRTRNRITRIIPAHAGFTLPRAARGLSPGSSPHTRGLLWTGKDDTITPRIIPAHAGFTVPVVGEERTVRDHPRTRGVYFPGLGLYAYPFGSSPHTRGLLVQELDSLFMRGIIPAHAGFTYLCDASVQGKWDHPRTRGVYR